MTRPQTRVDLGARDELFGNEAAEDEREDVFNSYALNRPELTAFCSPLKPLQIVRAYKGEGKSALLRQAGRQLATSSERLLISTTGPELSPDCSGTSFDVWVRAWKRVIANHVAAEIGAKIGWAWDDDGTSLVEVAEKSGRRGRSFISSILDRAEVKGMPARRIEPAPDSEALLARWKKIQPEIWLLVDDLDRAFENTVDQRARTASFFDACRQLTRSIPSLRIRTAIRPNTWTVLKVNSEVLSHVEQYCVELRWSESDVLRLLARRVEGYLQRTGQAAALSNLAGLEPEGRNKALLAIVFDSPVSWGTGQRPVHVPLYTLAQHRPRWVIELCRIAAQRAHAQGATKIGREHYFGELTSFGRRRIEDLTAEFRDQCPKIQEVLDGFRSQREQYRTDELLELIQNRITSHIGEVKIAGLPGAAGHRTVASFLFQIGFLFGRRDFDDGSYEHLSYTDQPSLLISRTDMDSGLSWEIPPTYRQALNLRTSEGFVRPKNKKPTRLRRRVVK